MDSKYIFTVAGVVKVIVVGREGDGVTFSGPTGSVKIVVPVETAVGLEWLYSGTPQKPAFTQPQ